MRTIPALLPIAALRDIVYPWGVITLVIAMSCPALVALQRRRWADVARRFADAAASGSLEQAEEIATSVLQRNDAAA